MKTTPPNPRKAPRQARAVATVDAIITATTRILQQHGLEKFNTNHIAAVAGVSVGTLYQYFPSKEAILTQLIRQKRQSLLTEVQSAIKNGRGSAQILSEILSITISHQMRWPMLSRSLDYAETFLALGEETQIFKSELLKAIAGFLATQNVPNANLTAQDLIFAVRGQIEGAILAGETDSAALLPRVEKLALAYIGEMENPVEQFP